MQGPEGGRQRATRREVAVIREPSIRDLWNATEPGKHESRGDRTSALPEAAARYLEHAVAPGAPLASTVRLRMHGEIRLQRWFPFRAEEIIQSGRGMIWDATVRMYGLPVRGSDRLLDGEGAMRWKLLGVIPVLTASGSDITRSAVGRLAAESVWLPSIFLGDGVAWKALGASTVAARFLAQGHPAALTLTVGDDGRLEALALERWGNAGGGDFRLGISGGWWRQRAPSGATRFRLACEWAGASRAELSVPMGSSSE